MTRRDWWLGVALVAVALLINAAYPRYEWRERGATMIRIDWWTGSAVVGRFERGAWKSMDPAPVQAAQQNTPPPASMGRPGAMFREEPLDPSSTDPVDELARRHGATTVLVSVPPIGADVTHLMKSEFEADLEAVRREAAAASEQR